MNENGDNNPGVHCKKEDCAVCLEKVSDSDSKTSCGHCFHRPCLMTWFVTSRTTTCPMCRSKLELSNEDLAYISNAHVSTYNNVDYDINHTIQPITDNWTNLFTRKNGSSWFERSNGSSWFERTNGSSWFERTNGSSWFERSNGSSWFERSN